MDTSVISPCIQPGNVIEVMLPNLYDYIVDLVRGLKPDNKTFFDGFCKLYIHNLTVNINQCWEYLLAQRLEDGADPDQLHAALRLFDHVTSFMEGIRVIDLLVTTIYSSPGYLAKKGEYEREEKKWQEYIASITSLDPSLEGGRPSHFWQVDRITTSQRVSGEYLIEDSWSPKMVFKLRYHSLPGRPLQKADFDALDGLMQQLVTLRYLQGHLMKSYMALKTIVEYQTAYGIDPRPAFFKSKKDDLSVYTVGRGWKASVCFLRPTKNVKLDKNLLKQTETDRVNIQAHWERVVTCVSYIVTARYSLDDCVIDWNA